MSSDVVGRQSAKLLAPSLGGSYPDPPGHFEQLNARNLKAWTPNEKCNGCNTTGNQSLRGNRVSSQKQQSAIAHHPKRG
jgi:hypothetical protein